MAAWREINEMRGDPKGCCNLAQMLFTSHGHFLTEWEAGFVESIGKKQNVGAFSTRQVELLLDLRDSVTPVEEIHGINLATLSRRCFEARADLPEADEEWIVALCAKPLKCMRRSEGLRLLRVARHLRLIESA